MTASAAWSASVTGLRSALVLVSKPRARIRMMTAAASLASAAARASSSMSFIPDT